MHRYHPTGFQIEKCSRGVRRVRMHVAKLRRIVSANRQQGHLGSQAPSDFTKAGEIGRVPGVIDRVPSCAQNVAPVTAMRVLDDARSPVTRWYMSDLEILQLYAAPPVEFHHFPETQVRYQIKHVVRHHDHRSFATLAPTVLHDGA